MQTPDKLYEVAGRIREMREIAGFSVEEMAARTEVSAEVYNAYEKGLTDFPFTFIHKCAKAFNIGITDILEGYSAPLKSYVVTRSEGGIQTSAEDGRDIKSLAPLFAKKIAEPYFVKYEYFEEQQNKPIHTTTHDGQEFDYVIEGSIKMRVGENIEVLNAGDSIFYNSQTPHGMIATGGKDAKFLAVVMPGEKSSRAIEFDAAEDFAREARGETVADDFINTKEDVNGLLKEITFKNADKFNFAFDVVDKLGETRPDEIAMVHIANDKTERRFTFKDMRRLSAQAANYFRSLGIKRGDKVMIILKRHYQFWFALLGLHKLGAIAIPATHQLAPHDLEYRFNAANVTAVIATSDGDIAEHIDSVSAVCPNVTTKVLVGGKRSGWRDYDAEVGFFTRKFVREEGAASGDDTLFMMFTSGTTGYPKIAVQSHKYPLGHYHTARHWHGAKRGGLHLTVSDTGWGKALWGKIYGEWLCECAVFVYDFDKFDASDILPMFKKYNITTFCAPPTMLRLMIKEDLNLYDLSSIKHMTTAGEALNPEVYEQFKKQTGLKIMEGFGQTETTLMIANLIGGAHKIGSMGKPVPLYDIILINSDGKEAGIGESGEICIRYNNSDRTCGLFSGYYNDDEATKFSFRGGLYHTGDIAWKDEDGFLWYVSRTDDVIKSSGYRIGPFEIESVIMELPYVLECGVSAAPDEIRGQVVKASIVLTKGTKPTDDLKKEIQNYVKSKTAPYKYPRIVIFRDELPKTISGKIQRNKL